MSSADFTQLPNLPQLEVPLTVATGAAVPIEGQKQTVLWIDAAGDATPLTGVVQLQGSIGGFEWKDEGSAINAYPAYYLLTKLYTHLRIKTTTLFGAGETPQALLYAFFA